MGTTIRVCIQESETTGIWKIAKCGGAKGQTKSMQPTYRQTSRVFAMLRLDVSVQPNYDWLAVDHCAGDRVAMRARHHEGLARR